MQLGLHESDDRGYWVSIHAEAAQGPCTGFGWCKWYQHPNEALLEATARSERRGWVNPKITVKIHDELPVFAQRRRDEWNNAAANAAANMTVAPRRSNVRGRDNHPKQEGIV